MSLLVLELNEVNFEQVQAYVARGRLPHLGALIAKHGLSRTSSESEYEALEPWIQWVTAHTGLPLADHGIQRLGDAVGAGHDQIWEVLERQGAKVGAISPMNAENRCRDAAFFLPDPWTPERVTGPAGLHRLHAAVAQMVNDNASARVTPRSALTLGTALLRYGLGRGAVKYADDMFGAVRRRPWRKAMLLDRLLADLFFDETLRHRPDFATLFLNAGAHIQHHYLFNSATYQGAFTNPAWYIASNLDPVFDVYALYDDVVGRARSCFPDARLMIATGLHQEPHGAVTFYWRLKDHAAFLRQAGVPFVSVEPRMSRDFVVVNRDAAEAAAATTRLRAMTSEQGMPMFDVDNRGDSLFVMLTWPDDIGADFRYRLDGRSVAGLREHVAFVAIKNGEHDGTGYLIDTGRTANEVQDIRLADLPLLMAKACGLDWTPDRAVQADTDRAATPATL